MHRSSRGGGRGAVNVSETVDDPLRARSRFESYHPEAAMGIAAHWPTVPNVLLAIPLSAHIVC